MAPRHKKAPFGKPPLAPRNDKNKQCKANDTAALLTRMGFTGQIAEPRTDDEKLDDEVALLTTGMKNLLNGYDRDNGGMLVETTADCSIAALGR